MNTIEIKNLTKQFKNVTAVHSLNLNISESEFFGLLGSNGAGKTTTIKMLCGLLAPSNGDAIMMGHSLVNDSEAVKQLINISPQETAIASHLTVKENLMLVARLYGADKELAKQKVNRIIEDFHLKEYENVRSKNLSGGWQRKLSIAMSLITNPKILFLDEPTLGLDVRARNDLWKTIEKLKGKATIILTTHYLEEAEALADRICIMNQGKIQVMGSAKEIVEKTGAKNFEEAFLINTEEVH